MLHNKLKLTDINHRFGVGNTLYYGCIFPHYDWFKQEFKVSNLIKPQSFKIISHKLMPSQIDNEDRFLLSRIDFNNVVRKYVLYLILENDKIETKTSMDIYENKDNNMFVLYENHVCISDTLEDALESFYKHIISIKSDIKFESEDTIIIDDINFKEFRMIYNEAKDIYPEEVIKSHDKNKKIV